MHLIKVADSQRAFNSRVLFGNVVIFPATCAKYCPLCSLGPSWQNWLWTIVRGQKRSRLSQVSRHKGSFSRSSYLLPRLMSRLGRVGGGFNSSMRCTHSQQTSLLVWAHLWQFEIRINQTFWHMNHEHHLVSTQNLYFAVKWSNNCSSASTLTLNRKGCIQCGKVIPGVARWYEVMCQMVSRSRSRRPIEVSDQTLLLCRRICCCSLSSAHQPSTAASAKVLPWKYWDDLIQRFWPSTFYCSSCQCKSIAWVWDDIIQRCDLKQFYAPCSRITQQLQAL